MWPVLSEHRFAFHKWKLCPVDSHYAGIGALRKAVVAHLARGPIPVREFFRKRSKGATQLLHRGTAYN